MAMTDDGAWDDVNWDLDFESFEWMVHLAACFNRHLPSNVPWTVWPDWPHDMLGFVVDDQRAGWLSALRLVHTHPNIAVEGNSITVTDSRGTARELEDVTVSSRWWHVDVGIDWDVPLDVVAALDATYGPSPSHAFIPGHLQQVCLGIEDDAASYGLGLSAVLQAMLDGMALFGKATDFHAARCRSCRETTYSEGLRGQGFVSSQEVTSECFWCSWETVTN
jgi:hypothetical protein